MARLDPGAFCRMSVGEVANSRHRRRRRALEAHIKPQPCVYEASRVILKSIINAEVSNCTSSSIYLYRRLLWWLGKNNIVSASASGDGMARRRGGAARFRHARVALCVRQAEMYVALVVKALKKHGVRAYLIYGVKAIIIK